MSLRMPRDLARLSRSGLAADNLSAIEVETMAETASSLGYQGRKVEKALAALAAAPEHRYNELLAAAGDAVWAFLVQRELCGMRDHRHIIREMGIPDIVLKRLGAAPKR